MYFFGLSLGFGRRKVVRASAPRAAPTLERTFGAEGISWQAASSAQFHDRLVEITGTVTVEQRGSFLLPCFGLCQQACQDTAYVAVHHRIGLPKRYAHDGCRR